MIALNLNAQIIATQNDNIIALELHDDYISNNNVKDGMYFKDINNKLNSFFGVWSGSYEDNHLELHITKYREDFAGISMDVLLIKYKIETNTGIELVNTLNLPDISNKHIFGSNFVNEFNLYKAWYEGELADCNQKGWAMIEQIDSQTLKLWITPNNMIIDNSCPDGNIHILPTAEADAVVLTKQN